MSYPLAGQDIRFLRRRPNTWYGPELRTDASTTNAAVAADTAYAFPILVLEAASIAEIAMVVGTAVAGVSGRLALYTCDPDAIAPRSLIVGGTTNLDMSQAAGTALSLTVPNFYCPGGVLMGVAKFNGAAQPRTLATGGNGTGSTMIERMFGGTSPALVLGATGTFNTRISATGSGAVFADPWPELWAASAWTVGTGAPGSPVMAFRTPA